MKNLIKILPLIIVLSLQTKTNKAQTEGFLGKRNQFSIDAFSAINYGNYSGNYYYCLSKHSMLQLGFGYQTKSYDVPLNSQFSNITTNDKSTFQSVISASRFTIGLIFNGSSAGLNLPIGYYSGVLLKVMFADVDNIIPAGKIYTYEYNSLSGTSSTYLNASPLNFQCKTKSYALTWVMGKNYYLGSNITLDLSVEMGLALYHYIYSNHIYDPNNYDSEYAYAIMDNTSHSFTINNPPTPFVDVAGYNTGQKIFQPNSPVLVSLLKDLGTLQTGYTSARIVFMPSIKLGYIF